MSQLWTTFNTLQLIMALFLLQAEYPSNVHHVYKVVVDVINQ